MPELTDEQLKSMKRVGRPPIGEVARVMVSFRLDRRVLARLRQEASRRHMGYQTLMHEVLAAHADTAP